MKLLITAFDPFGGETVNPAEEVLRRLPDRIGEYTVYKLEIPTVFREAGDITVSEMKRIHPDAVISLGQAGGRDGIQIERVAVNLMDTTFADNAGDTPCDEPCVKDGPAAYFSTLPVKTMEEAVRKAGFPCRISYSAGVYVCNSVMYRVLHASAQDMPETRCGFIHLPFLPEQIVGREHLPSMEQQDMVSAIFAAIAAL